MVFLKPTKGHAWINHKSVLVNAGFFFLLLLLVQVQTFPHLKDLCTLNYKGRDYLLLLLGQTPWSVDIWLIILTICHFTSLFINWSFDLCYPFRDMSLWIYPSNDKLLALVIFFDRQALPDPASLPRILFSKVLNIISSCIWKVYCFKQ